MLKYIKKCKRCRIAISLSMTIIINILLFSNCTAFASDINVTAKEIVNNINVGWNLGNSLDSYHKSYESQRPNNLGMETLWGNPRITKSLIDYVAGRGFNTIRIPVTWYYNTSADSTGHLVINPQWLARVKQVVNYAIVNNMYVIINSHHDMPIIYAGTDDVTMTKVLSDAQDIWSQIATSFKSYDEHLIFEAYNEVDNKASSWNYSDKAAQQMNMLNQVFVDTVRAAGEYNSKRVLIVPTLLDGVSSPILDAFTMPNDSVSGKIIAEVHTYNMKFSQNIESDFIELEKFSKRINAPVIIGEFGTTSNYPLPEHRTKHAANFVARAAAHGIKCIWWDNGSEYAIINRNDYSASNHEIINALMEGTKGTAYLIQNEMVLNSMDSFVYLQPNLSTGKLENQSWGALTTNINNNGISVTPGKICCVSLKAINTLADVYLQRMLFYDINNKYIQGVEIKYSSWTKYYFYQVPGNAAAMRISFINPYRKTPEATYISAFNSGDLELSINLFSPSDVIKTNVEPVPYEYNWEFKVKTYSITADGANIGNSFKPGSSNILNFEIDCINEISDVYFICAQYGENNRLLNLGYAKQKLNCGNNSVSVTINTLPTGNITFKAFIWEASNCYPLYSVTIPCMTQ